MELVKEWKLDDNEVEIGKKNMQFILRVYHTEKWTKDEVHLLFAEWKRIATRLKKGGQMLDSTQAIRPDSVNHLEKVNGLYRYLLRMLGVFDALFKHMLMKNEDAYRNAQNEILALIK